MYYYEKYVTENMRNSVSDVSTYSAPVEAFQNTLCHGDRIMLWASLYFRARNKAMSHGWARAKSLKYLNKAKD